MAIKVECSCGMTLMSLQGKPGDTITCRHCGAEFTIPEEGAQAGSSPQPQTPTARTAPANGTQDPSEIIYDGQLADQSALGIPRVQPMNVNHSSPNPMQQSIAQAATETTTSHRDAAARQASVTGPQPNGQTNAAESNTGIPRSGDSSGLSIAGARTCSNCGAKLSSKAAVCVSCGTDLKTGKQLTTQHIKAKPVREYQPSGLSRGISKLLWVTASFLIVVAISIFVMDMFMPTPGQTPIAVTDDRAGIATTHTNGVIEDARLNITLFMTPKEEKIELKIRMILTGKQRKPVKGKLYRARTEEGPYKLCSVLTPKESLDYHKRPQASYSYEDKQAHNEATNRVFYRFDVYDAGGKLLETFDPVCVPVVRGPRIKLNSWTWKPIAANAPTAPGYLTMRSQHALITKAYPLDKAIDDDFSKWPKDQDLSVWFEFNHLNKTIMGGDFVTRVTFDQRDGFYRLYECSGAIDVTRFASQPGFLHRDKGTRFVYASALEINGKKVRVPRLKGWRVCVINGKKVKQPRLPKVDETLMKIHPGSNVVVTVENHDLVAQQIEWKKQVKLYIPPQAPRIKVEATKDGNLVKWENYLQLADRSKFVVLPNIVLLRDGYPFAILPVDSTFFLDSAVTKGKKYVYSMYLDGGIIKTWGYVKGVPGNDYMTDMETYSGTKDPLRQEVVAQIDKSRIGSKSMAQLAKEFREKRDPDSLVNVVKEKKVMPRPIRVAILRPAVCYQGTGHLEAEALAEVTKGLAEQENIVFYDWCNLPQVLSRLTPRYQRLPEGLSPLTHVDFVVQIGDYSHSDSNGIDVVVKAMLPPEEANPFTKDETDTWRIARVSVDGARPDWRADVVGPLVQTMTRSYDRKTAAANRGREKLNTILFDIIQPIEQEKPVWQYRQLTESMSLALSECVGDIAIMGRDDWTMANRELFMMQQLELGTKKNEKLPPSCLLSGRVWTDKQGYHYLFMATDTGTGRMLGSRTFHGQYKNVAKDLGRWCASLRLCKASIGGGGDKEKLLSYLPLGETAFPKRKCVAWYNEEPDDLLFKQHASHRGAVKVAKQQWKNGHRLLAVNILQEAWHGRKQQATADALAECYHELGMYALEAGLLADAEKQGILVKRHSARLNKARSLAVNTSSVVKMDMMRKSLAATTGSRRRNDALPTLNDGVSAVIHADHNSDYERLLYCARQKVGVEWNSSGHTYTNKLYTITKSRETMKQWQSNHYGVWREIMTHHSKQLTGYRIWATTWWAYPAFHSKKGNLAMRTEAVRDAKSKVRLFYELSQLGDQKVFLKKQFVDSQGVAMDGMQYITNEAIIPMRQIGKRDWSIYLHDLVAIDILASRGNSKAQSALRRVKELRLPDDHKEASRMIDLIAYRAVKGDPKAEAFFLAHKDSDCVGYTGSRGEDFAYLLAKNKRKKLLLCLLDRAELREPMKYALVRWADKKFIKSLLINDWQNVNPLFSYLAEGYGLKDELTPKLLEKDDRGSQSLLVRLHGKPLDEIIAASKTTKAKPRDKMPLKSEAASGQTSTAATVAKSKADF